jgi:hypothetical protein
MSEKKYGPEKRAAQAEDGKKAWAEYRAAADGVTDKIARLRAARLARDAQERPAPKPKRVIPVRKPARLTNTDE